MDQEGEGNVKEHSAQKEKRAGERRQHPRYRVRDGALAFLGTTPGTIVDISEQGLAIHYVVLERKPDHRFQLDIFFADDEFYLADLPVEMVSDVSPEPQTLFSSIQVRRLGLKFGRLTDEQRDRLRYFILHNTVAEA